jgi:hypothetical protein
VGGVSKATKAAPKKATDERPRSEQHRLREHVGVLFVEDKHGCEEAKHGAEGDPEEPILGHCDRCPYTFARI